MKKAFYIGAAAGGLLGIIVSLSMDLMLGNSLGSGWGESVAHDLNHVFKTNLPENHILVVLGVFVVIGIIVAFGAIMGGIFTMMITRFFRILTKEK